MNDNRFIQTISLRNLLSFGESSEEIELRPLNVLIGPNASGKSNLIEAISILKAAPTDLAEPFRRDSGIGEWLWKGGNEPPFAEIEVTVTCPYTIMKKLLHHRIIFSKEGICFRLYLEEIRLDSPQEKSGDAETLFYHDEDGNVAPLAVKKESDAEDGNNNKRMFRMIDNEKLESDKSILSQYRDPDRYPELTYLGEKYSSIKLYREFNLGRNAQPRIPQPADLATNFLCEDASNLGHVLNAIEHKPDFYEFLIEKMKLVYESLVKYSVRIEGGAVQIYMHEKGMNEPIPATRLSDGTLRYLCLLAILCHPNPPPLICLEEPELGLHPDIIPEIAKLLVEASKRTQLIVTTHSDILVDALTDTPESVLVCEKEKGSTIIRRLDAESLKEWLEKYTLGELWMKGELGGTRW